jgi:TolB-like protein/DNA-binding winged helix-turn-helix (wHTH) protein/tetratricopeptide (TPR) repeat protein
LETNSPTRRKIRFGVFQVDLASGELYKHGIRIKLQEQPFQVLAVLLEHPGEMVTREELRQRLWGHDTYVDFDHSLNISINKLREALGDSAATPRFIETLPRRGYRFVAPVTVEEPAAPAPAPVVEAAAAPTSAAQVESATTSSTPIPTRTNRAFSAVVIAVALGLAISAVWLRPWQGNSSGAGRVMLAVLPFQDLSRDHSQDYFIAGLHDEMIAQLGHLNPARLGVIARTSTIQPSLAQKPIDQIGRDLRVDYVLEGTIRRDADRFRITAELIKVSDMTQMWTETYEVKLGDMLTLQEDIGHRVSDALSMEFLPAMEQQMQQRATRNAEAYEAYLKGRFLWHQETRQASEQAIALFQKAITLDPNYAPAYVGLADTYDVMGGYGFVPADEAFPKGKAAAAKALELAPNLSDAYSSMAFAAFYYDWNFVEAERLFRQALQLDPNNVLAHEFYGSFLHVMGRLDEAEAENQLAKKLDPLDGWLYDDKGWILLTRRRPQDAVSEFQKSVELNPSFPAGHLSLAVAYLRTQQYDKALAEVQKAEELGGDPTRVLEILGSAQATSGDKAGAEATVHKLVTGNISGRVSPYSIALIYTALGRKSEALDWLEKGYKEKDTWIIWVGVLQEWQSLRSEPRFMNLLHELKLPVS